MKRLKRTTPVFATYQPIRIGVSSCLLGANVRFDGGHKRNDSLIETLGKFVEFVPVCPEVEIGLGVPRDTLRLVYRDDSARGVRLISNATGVDYSDRMNSYTERRVTMLAGEELSGYVVKRDSPSCGMERVRVYGPSGMPTRDGAGLFAATLIRRYPSLPVEDEGRLADPNLRENFIERVFAYRRLRSFFSSRWSFSGLLQFHMAHRLVLMAHSPKAYDQLDLFTRAKRTARGRVREDYEVAFMKALKRLATTARHTNVLRQMLGHVRPHLDQDSREELTKLINNYRRGLVPLDVPISLFRYYARRFEIAYLRGQVYLHPYPKELMVRNHV
jgi:uncharacterized protein YbbK (DUF523 family)/uncharacterized protein YbgA (DUF1722 family)